MLNGAWLLDALVAGFAALAVAFVAWAMPNELFSGLVAASGLPAIVAAAEPPLGDTARLLVMLALAGGIFLLLFLALRLIGRRPVRPRAAFGPQAPIVPRLRRADAHPDAPSRAPISAMLELGTPLPPPWPEPAIEEWEETPAASIVAGPVPEVPELMLGNPSAPEPNEQVAAIALPEETRENRPPPIGGGETIAELMQRLERGLSRLATDSGPADTPSAPQPEPAPADQRLRSAIADLQRLATRG